MTASKSRLREAAINGDRRRKKLLEDYPVQILAEAERKSKPFEFLRKYQQRRLIQESRKELLGGGFSPEVLDEAEKSDDPLAVLRKNILASLPSEIQTAAITKRDEDFGKYVMDYIDLLDAADSQTKAKQMLFKKSVVLPPDFARVTRVSATDDLALMMQTADDFIFENLKFAEGRNLADSWLQSRIKIASEYNDQRFFKRLGRALSEPTTKKAGIVFPNKLSQLLVTGWMPVRTKTGRAPGLCWFTDEALTEVCRTILGNKSLTLDTVRKTRQRLGLKHAGKPWITRVKVVNGKIVFSSRWAMRRNAGHGRSATA